MTYPWGLGLICVAYIKPSDKYILALLGPYLEILTEIILLIDLCTKAALLQRCQSEGHIASEMSV
jgi:hypothetical protein